MHRTYTGACAAFLTVAWGAALRADAPAVQLASGGRAAVEIVTGPQAGQRVKKAAAELALQLGRISGAEFQVKTGDGQSGVAVGTPGDFPALAKGLLPRVEGPAGRETYLLRTHDRGLYVIGATELAVEHAAWDLLYRLGHRQFFPGELWEVVPHQPELSVAVDALEKPDYCARRIWYGFGTWDYNAGPYAAWCQRNRAASGLELHTGHSYEGIISRNRAAFEAHPEYYALVGGARRPSKFCISNPALRKLVVEDALRQFREKPEMDSISLDPSDGGGWCECDACARMGSVSDRVVTLANEAAEAVQRQSPGKLVGIYAYASHSPPPAVRVGPNVIVSVATAFIRGGFTLDELIDGWARQGATLGVREYYGVHTWDRDLPGKARGARLDYLARTIPEFHAKGARFLSAESSDNWGPSGLGYYVAARILWDVDEARRVPRIVDDFLARAFGPAKEPMGRYYRLIGGPREPPLPGDLLARMYRALDEAWRLADSPQVRARIGHLVLYTRYVEFFHDYSAVQGEARQAAFERLLRHGYRMRASMMIHAKALARDLPARDKQVSVPAEAAWNVPEGKNPWKSSEPFSDADLRRMLDEGLARFQPVEPGFEPGAFSGNLVPAAGLTLGPVEPGALGAGRGVQTFYAWIEKAPATIELEITGGLIAHYRDRGNVKVELWQGVPGPETREKEKPVAADRSVPPDGLPRTVRLAAAKPGVHTITVSDGSDMTRVGWKPGTPVCVRSGLEEPLNASGRWSLWFYVPRGTKLVGLFADGGAQVFDPQGKKALDVPGGRPGYYSAAVPPGADGRLWRLSASGGGARLMTVPPYLGRSGEELLLPREVVARNSGKD